MVKRELVAIVFPFSYEGTVSGTRLHGPKLNGVALCSSALVCSAEAVKSR